MTGKARVCHVFSTIAYLQQVPKISVFMDQSCCDPAASAYFPTLALSRIRPQTSTRIFYIACSSVFTKLN